MQANSYDTLPDGLHMVYGDSPNPPYRQRMAMDLVIEGAVGCSNLVCKAPGHEAYVVQPCRYAGKEYWGSAGSSDPYFENMRNYAAILEGAPAMTLYDRTVMPCFGLEVLGSDVRYTTFTSPPSRPLSTTEI